MLKGHRHDSGWSRQEGGHSQHIKAGLESAPDSPVSPLEKVQVLNIKEGEDTWSEPC